METTPSQNRVWFPEWAIVLQRQSLTVAQRESHRLTLVRYLYYCKSTKTPVTVASARQFVESAVRKDNPTPEDLANWKAALNWFFREAREYRRHQAHDIPPLARTDLGKTEWERRLIRHLRSHQYRLRTEQAYRAWAWRFARWLEKNGAHGGLVVKEDKAWERCFDTLSMTDSVDGVRIWFSSI
jgi:hypothetical protein